jgi:hypothetical protein
LVEEKAEPEVEETEVEETGRSPQLEATIKEIRRIQQGNIEKVNALRSFGRGIDPGSVANIKIDTFIEYFLDEEAQAAYVLAMERKLREALDSALSEVRQQSLVEGLANKKNSGLIIPG